ncbi:MAG: ABC transporter ATP-binding protein [Clostridia bacterium]
MNSCLKMEISGISKSFGEKNVLKGVDISLNQGEIVSLLGVSGAGKTTLFNVISGLLEPDSGFITLDGENITNTTGKVSYMLQKDLLMPHKTVIENIALPLIIKGIKKKDAFAEVDKFFKTFGLDGYQKKYPKELSGGMCQRAALLRTYMFSNNVALLDEPFSALDTMTKGKLQAWYLEIMEKIQLSTIFITHDIDEAIYLSDRVYILSEGKIANEVIIDCEKPRSREFMLTNEFLQYKRAILNTINVF